VNQEIKLLLQPCSKMVRDFELSKYSFAFCNKFSDSIIYWQHIPVGNAKYGLCGGMCVASALYYQYQLQAPQLKSPPDESNYPQLFAFIKQCQIGSLSLAAVYKYFRLMFSLPHKDAQVLSEQAAKIIAAINQDQLCLLGIIKEKTKFYLPQHWSKIFNHHQVLAYGYTITHDETIILHVYDPNCPLNITIQISFKPDGSNLRYSPSLIPIYTLFKADYSFKLHPPQLSI
jgi:hypothetical protein